MAKIDSFDGIPDRVVAEEASSIKIGLPEPPRVTAITIRDSLRSFLDRDLAYKVTLGLIRDGFERVLAKSSVALLSDADDYDDESLFKELIDELFDRELDDRFNEKRAD